MTKEEISKRLQDLRIAKGYTQKQLAELLGMKNYSTISSWEIGKSEPSLSMFERLCSIYGISKIQDVFPELENQENVDSVTLLELAHIKKYRLLTEPNRQAVDFTIDGMLAAQDAQKRGASPAKNSEKGIA